MALADYMDQVSCFLVVTAAPPSSEGLVSCWLWDKEFSGKDFPLTLELTAANIFEWKI